MGGRCAVAAGLAGAPRPGPRGAPGRATPTQVVARDGGEGPGGGTTPTPHKSSTKPEKTQGVTAAIASSQRLAADHGAEL